MVFFSPIVSHSLDPEETTPADWTEAEGWASGDGGGTVDLPLEVTNLETEIR